MRPNPIRALFLAILTFGLSIATGFSQVEGLVGYWRLNGDLSDSSGNGNDAVAYGGTFVQARLGLGLALDGTDDYLSVADDATLDLNSFTIELWVRIEKGPGVSQTFVDKSGDGESSSVNSNYLLQTINDNSVVTGFEVASGNPDPTAYGCAILPTDEFMHIAGVFDADADQLTVYMNGVKVGSTSTSATPNQQNQPILIGRNPGPYQHLEGVIDEIRLWSVARTQSEILAYMNQEIIVDCEE